MQTSKISCKLQSFPQLGCVQSMRSTPFTRCGNDIIYSSKICIHILCILWKNMHIYIMHIMEKYAYIYYAYYGKICIHILCILWKNMHTYIYKGKICMHCIYIALYTKRMLTFDTVQFVHNHINSDYHNFLKFPL